MPSRALPVCRALSFALMPGEAWTLLMLLTLLSDTTAGTSRLKFIHRRVKGVGTLLRVRGPRISGCLTSEDEERETWTAESLRVSILKTSVFPIGTGRKTSAVHVLN